MFIIRFGTRMFGKRESVPGVGHIATKFFHIYYVPLIPLGSFFIVEGGNTGEDYGVPLANLCWRSVGFAWFRTWLVVSLITLVFLFSVSVGVGSILESILYGALFVATVSVFYLSYRWTRLRRDSLDAWGNRQEVPHAILQTARAALEAADRP